MPETAAVNGAIGEAPKPGADYEYKYSPDGYG